MNSKHGRLLVVDFAGRDKARRPWWTCRCDCGATVKRRQDSLQRKGRTHSCGCALREKRTKHGHRYSSTYQTWRAMRKRCNDPKNKSWVYYGGRGITVCPEWDDSDAGFATFLRDVGERPRKTTLDRIDNERGYEKGNVRWATRLQQAANRRAAAKMIEDMLEDAREYAAGEAEEAAFLARGGA